MALWKTVLKYTALAVGALVLVSAVVSVVGTLLGIAVSILVSILSLLALVAMAYALVKGILWLRGTGSDATDVTHGETGSRDQVTRTRERYVDGELSEAELERRLERELNGPGSDEIDRELERSRSK